MITCIIFIFQEVIVKTEEKGSMKEKVDAMQKKYDVSSRRDIRV